ncbi:MAG: glycosyltransferase family 2 protein [bacterium]
MKISIIIPALNEIESIGKVLEEIPNGVADEIIISDGHSTDGTQELVRKMGYKVIEQEGKGFGAAITSGIKEVKGDVVIIVNADGSQNPKDIPLLLEKMKEGYDMVLASRYLPGAGSEDDTWLHCLGNKMFTFFCNVLYGVGISDSLYFFLAAKKEIFEKIKLKSPNSGYAAELPIKAHRAGFKIAEIPSFERKRTGGKAKVNAFTNGLQILLTILKP